MPPEEDSKHLTAFCSSFGVFEWNVLPMGVREGPVAFQEMVQHVTRSCPSSKPYIDDIMSTNGKEILDRQKNYNSPKTGTRNAAKILPRACRKALCLI